MPTADPRSPRVDLAGLDLATPRVVHIVALGGGAMSALATVLTRMGHRVERIRPARLAHARAHPAARRRRARRPRRRQLPPDADMVIASTAIGPDNPEVVRARELGIPVLRRADAQRLIVATRRAVAVAGSHGKTTTSSMLALILRAAGWHPSFLIGAVLNEVGANAMWDDGEWLVVEADESDGTFLELDAEAAIVTNVEPDHLNYYGTFAALRAAFEQFVDSTPGACVVSADDPIARELAARRDGRGDLRVRRRRALRDAWLRGPTRRHEVRARARRRRGRGARAPDPGTAQRDERGRGRGDGDRDRGAVRADRARARRVRRRQPVGSSSAASATASPTSTTTRTCPARCTA